MGWDVEQPGFFIFLVVSESIPEKSLGTGIGKKWYREKVSEPVSEKFGNGTDFRRKNLGI